MEEEMNVICPCCGSIVPPHKFCRECGYKFSGSEERTDRELSVPQTQTVTNNPAAAVPKHIEPARGALSMDVICGGMMPGENGRGAVRTCGICGNRYTDTGIGCPFCAARRSGEKKEE